MEYYFDVDPGFGNATEISIITPDSSLAIVEEISTSGLPTGFHVLGLRARNVASNPKINVLDTGTQILEAFNLIDPSLRMSGQWGMTETRLVFIGQSSSGSVTLVDQIEYYFDIDPGIGNAAQISSFSPNNTISINESLSTDTLTFGFHILGMRARAQGGAWSTTETRLVFVDQTQGVSNVDQIEYFFDSDPGVGNATIIDSFTANDTISINQALTTDTLSFGFHILGIRARAQGGAWSTTETRLIFVDQTQGVANVDQIEYFFDNDPGVGSATIIDSFTANDTISINQALTTDTLSFGFHILGIRARAQGGAWSTT
ncbi:MAG: hypothetical protein HRT61_05290, partial [Ekhidna sp.]|nr:hypothetical protein [Ekhidna sp.]